jgi:formylglycine-generating enzyme required for sulfatase activity
LQTALELAHYFSGSNRDWTPVIQQIDSVEMVLVPAGCFVMGSTDEQIDYAVSLSGQPGWFTDEQPSHQVCFEEPFWIDRTEVTNAQFAAFDGQAANSSNWTDSERPRENITWTEAKNFCGARGARLPTEAEWEYAARGPEGWIFPWGNTFLADSVVYDSNSGDHTSIVGSKPDGASWVGALDLSGNVSEWVADWYGPYPAEQQTNPTGASSGDTWVERGGAFNVVDSFVRAASRLGYSPTGWDKDLGFRCTRSADTGSTPVSTLMTAPTSEVTATLVLIGKVTPSDTVNLRVKPGIYYSVVATVPPSTQVNVIGQQGDWYHVQLNDGTEGWILASLLTVFGNPDLLPTPDWSALELARNYSGNNRDWTPVVQKFDGVEMVLVPAGCFMMGSTDEQIDYAVSLGGQRERFADEQPAHQVCFEEPFWMDRTEVTNAQFAVFGGQAASSSNWTEDNRPREQIAWSEANSFCESRKARLPTEAEWEYAARGPENWTFPWGNKFVSDNVVYSGNSGNQTAEVGSRPGGVSWVGALDLSGNVVEWVADWYDLYTSDQQTNPTGPSSSDSRVLRGGSFSIVVSDIRDTVRYWSTPDYRYNYSGFRCARPAGG